MPRERAESLPDQSVFGALFLSLFVLYSAFHCRTFGPGDSPQHVLSSVTWGVSVAPGYPFYVILGKLVSMLPFGTPASNVNALSSCLHAGTVAALFLVLRLQGVARLPALVGSCLMGLSRLFWYYSEIAEVRALNDFLAIGTAVFILLAVKGSRPEYLIAVAAFLGLGIGHHPTFVLILPALAYLLQVNRVILSGPRMHRPFRLASAFLFCVAAPYFVLWLRLQRGAPVWNPAETKTAHDVWALFTRQSVGGPLRMVIGTGVFGFGSFDDPRFLQHLLWFATACWTDVNPAGLALAAIGANRLWRRDRQTLFFWALWVFVSAFVFIGISSQQLILCDSQYVRGMVLRFYLLPYIGIFALAGFGAAWLVERTRPAFGWALLAAAILIPILARPINLSHHDTLMEYCRLMVKTTGPSDMIMLAPDDTILAMSYLELAERSTEDRVLLIPSLFAYPPYIRRVQRQHPTLKIPPLENRTLTTDWSAWLKANPNRRLYAEAVLRDTLLERAPNTVPRGVLAEIRLKPADKKEVAENAKRFLDETPDDLITRWGIFDFTQEVYLTRTYHMLLEWYGTYLDPQDPAAALIRARLEAL